VNFGAGFLDKQFGTHAEVGGQFLRDIFAAPAVLLGLTSGPLQALHTTGSKHSARPKGKVHKPVLSTVESSHVVKPTAVSSRVTAAPGTVKLSLSFRLQKDVIRPRFDISL
jgi:hypothetical protein